MLKFILLHLLFAAVFHSSFGSSSCDSECPDNAEIDVFHMYTKREKEEKLEFIALNEAPRTKNTLIDLDQPSFHFAGSESLSDTGTKPLMSLVCGMCARHSITFHGTLFFTKNDNGGPLIVLNDKNTKTTAFSIEVSTAGNTITAHYMHQRRLMAQTFNIELKRGVWYKVALQFDGNRVNFFVNCRLVESRLIPIPEYCFSDKSFTLVVGRSDNYYSGSLQSVRALSTSSTNPMAKQCPDIDTDIVDCPICGSYLSSLKELKSEQNTVVELESQLTDAKADLVSYEELKAKEKVKCEIDSVRYDHGAFAKTRENEICFCQYGEAHCVNPDSLSIAPPPTEAVLSTMVPTPTPKPSLENPSQMCGTKMVGNTNIMLAVDEVDYTLVGDQCVINTCEQRIYGLDYADEEVPCASVNDSCALLTDDRDQQLAVCCKHCDACSVANCPPNSKCFPVGRDFQCHCNEGFVKFGDICIDVDECSAGTDDCPTNSTCSNTVGSFECNCPEFYKIDTVNGKKECVDIDECTDVDNMHNCPAETTCENKPNGFICNCEENFELQDDNTCKPICKSECVFGNCTSPDECTCFEGYQGKYCDQDINECNVAPEDDPCASLSDTNVTRCVNTFGGYFCSCITGFQRTLKKDGSEVCLNFNECDLQIDNCPEGSTCLNTGDTYVCKCKHGNCDRKCILEDGKAINTGETIEQGCDICTCNEGDYTCKRKQCDCSDPNVNTRCCPECLRTNYCFSSQGLTLKVGDFHVNNCTKMTCEEGSNGPMLTSSRVQCPTLDCQKQYTPTGACCPVCSLPVCSGSNSGSTVEIKKDVGDGCETCSCNGSEWNCPDSVCSTATCQPLGDCPAKYVTFLSSSDDCPVCLSSDSQQLCSM